MGAGKNEEKEGKKESSMLSSLWQKFGEKKPKDKPIYVLGKEEKAKLDAGRAKEVQAGIESVLHSYNTLVAKLEREGIQEAEKSKLIFGFVKEVITQGLNLGKQDENHRSTVFGYDDPKKGEFIIEAFNQVPIGDLNVGDKDNKGELESFSDKNMKLIVQALSLFVTVESEKKLAVVSENQPHYTLEEKDQQKPGARTMLVNRIVVPKKCEIGSGEDVGKALQALSKIYYSEKLDKAIEEAYERQHGKKAQKR